MSSLKDELKDKLSSDLSKYDMEPYDAPETSYTPEAKLCSSCRFRSESVLKGKIDGAKLGTCQKYNDNSVGYKSKPHDVLWGNASCQWYEKEVVR